MAYEKDKDYSQLIADAVSKKDYVSAAKYEQMRNEKIDGEGVTNYAKTNDYAGNLDTTDYSTNIRNMMTAGASSDDVKAQLDSRVKKANNAVNLKQYAYDDLFGQANEYIRSKNLEEMTYADAPEYLSKNQQAIDALMASIQGNTYDKFLGTDQYAALSNEYTKNGQAAMRDTMADAAARTGGLASSYAQSAGQQAYGNYMNGLEDAAMNAWSADRARQIDEMGLLQNQESMDYAKYADQLNQYNNDRSFGYTASQNELASKNQLAEDKANIMASAGDYAYMKDLLGLSDEDVAKLVAYDQAQAKSGGSGGGGKKSGDSTADGIYWDMYNAGIRSDADAYAYLDNAGYNTSDSNKYSEYYKQKLDSGEFTKNFASVYGKAYSMKQSGKSNQEILDYLDEYAESHDMGEGQLENIVARLQLVV